MAVVALLCFRSIRVRRILKRRGPGLRKFEKNKGPNQHFWPKIFRHYLTIFCPKLGEDQKNKKDKRSSLKFSPIHLGVGQNQRSSPTICGLKASAQLTKGGGGIPQFCILNYANYTILARGGVEDTRLEAKDTQKNPRPRTHKKIRGQGHTKKSEAKDSLSEDRPSRGQGQECSRPRTKDTGASVLQKKGFQKRF